MSGVSIGSQNVDLDAIVAGGDSFLARVKQLQQAKVDAESALSALSLGRDVAQAMRDAQAKEQASVTMIADAKVDAETVLASARASAAEITSKAQADADAMLATAKQKSETLETEVNAARAALTSWSEQMQAETNTLHQRAAAALAAAERKAAENDDAAKTIAAMRADVLAAKDAATSLQAALTSKLEAIRAAAS